MKKLLFILTLLLLPSVASAVTIIEPAPQANHLVLFGKVVNKERINVTVFEHDPITDEWINIQSDENAKKYELLLNPKKAYQVWFQHDSGYLKILYIDPGDAGTWVANLNINFTDNSLAYMHLYQTCNDDDAIRYHAEGLSTNGEDANIPATNCESCEMQNDDFTVK